MLYKQDSQYTAGPKYTKILNMTKFWIWQGSEYASVPQRSEYARTRLGQVLNVSWIPNMSGFWILQGSEYASVTQGFECHNMAEYVWIGREYVWIYDNRKGSEYGLYNT